MKLKLHGMVGLLAAVAGSCALVQSAQAGASTFNYTNRDLMLVFRQTGFDGSGNIGNIVFEVDIGQASLYYGATQGSSVPVTAYSATSQLNTLFANLNDLSWSVAGCVPNGGDSGSASKPPGTLWVTDPRVNGPTVSSPDWIRKSSYSQGGADSHIVAILANGYTWATSFPGNSVTNSATALAIPASSGDNANGSLGALGNYLGTFYGDGDGLNDVENTTSPTFNTDGLPSRSDLFELQPGSGEGTYLGYFELATNGAMTFYALPQSVPAPSLTVGTDGAGNIDISFVSAAFGTYTLFYTSANNLTAPVSSWSSVSTNIIGDGTVKTFAQPISHSGSGTVFAIGVQ